MAIVLTILCCASVTALLFAERSRRIALKRVAKTTASACFVALGLLLWPGEAAPAPWILLGLVLGACGDIALLFSGQAAFLAGLGAFLLGHLAYVVAFSAMSPLSAWLSLPVVPVAIFGLTVLGSLWKRLGPMRGPVIAYVVVICSMVVGAFAVYRSGAAAGPMVLVGALLFAVSDVAVARERFVRDRFLDKAWGLPTYYAGQLCIAWALSSLA